MKSIAKKLTRLPFIPNVTKFRISSKVASAQALLMGVVKYSRSFETEKLKSISKRNLYLSRNYSRLANYARKGDVGKFERLALTLIRSSKTYQLAALCSASKDWYAKPVKRVLAIWRAISRIRDSTDLKYQRWWIDKKPGDFARPIGAPTLEWKVNMIKYLRILEIYYTATESYPNWQHAGIGGRGLISAWKELLLVALPSKYIYEFDIKGFFDNIANQDAVRELPHINKRINQMVNTQPSGYNLPPEETLQEELDFGLLHRTSGLFGMGYWSSPYAEFPEDSAVWTKKVYKLDPNGNPIERAGVIAFGPSPMDLARAKDRNKGLGKEDHGFPQGANFSPFLSCLVLGKALEGLKGLMMYMDDGLIYAETKAELGQRLRRLRERLQTVGLSLAEEKSRLVKEPGRFESFRFLGIRVNSNMSIESETRSGTKVSAHLEILDRETYDKLAEYLEVPDQYDDLVREFISQLRTPYAAERRVKSWMLTKARKPYEALQWALSRGLFQSEAPKEILSLEHSIKTNYFSNIVARIFNPEIGTEDRRQLVGELEKLGMIYKKNSLSNVVTQIKMKDQLYVPDITTISTECCRYLMKRLRTKSSTLARRKQRRY